MTKAPDSESGGTALLTWHVEQRGEATIVHVAGEIDLVSEPAFVEAVERAVAAPADLVVVDLADVTFMGSSGLRTLLQARLQTTDRGQTLRIAVGHTEIRRVLQVSGVDKVMATFETVEQALAG